MLFSETSLVNADYVLCQELSVEDLADESSLFLEKVETSKNGRRYFVHKVFPNCAEVFFLFDYSLQKKGLRYVFDSDRNVFSCFSFAYAGAPFADLHRQATAMPDERREELFGLCGPNKMQVDWSVFPSFLFSCSFSHHLVCQVPVPTVVELLVDELLHPFYIFQVVSVTIWVLQFYFIYASCIFVLATAALIFSVVQVEKEEEIIERRMFMFVFFVLQTRRNNQALFEMASHSCGVNVLRGGGKTVMVDSKQLVPGDVVMLEQSAATIVCDMVSFS